MTFPQRSDLRADRFQSSFLARKVRRHYFPHMSTVMWPSPVRNVVKGQRLQTVSDALQFTYSALRTWVHRFANQGTAGLVDRPRPGRPPTLTCE